MLLLGITGAICGGKTTVADMFMRLSAGRLDADAAGHAVLELPEIREALRRRWGAAVFSPEGTVSRPAVAAIVFAPTEEGRRNLLFLQELTHPLIALRLREQIERLRNGNTRVAVLDAPLLYEAGWDRLVEKVVFVDCSVEIRRRRARARGWTEEQFDNRDARQWAPEEKRRRADWTVSTHPETLDETAARVETIWRLLSRTGDDTSERNCS